MPMQGTCTTAQSHPRNNLTFKYHLSFFFKGILLMAGRKMKKTTFRRRSLLSFLSKAFLSYIGNGHKISRGDDPIGKSLSRRRISQMNLSGGFLHRNGKILQPVPLYRNPLSPRKGIFFHLQALLTNFLGK